MLANTGKIPISTLIVDDEVLARSLIASLVQRDGDLLLVGECDNGADALEVIRRKKPDLVFLDVQMPLQNGVETAAKLARFAHPPYVIFVTAYTDYAVQAFELDALDYLVKPVAKERFGRAVQRAKRAIRDGEMVALTERLLTLSRSAEAPGAGDDDIELTVRVGDALVHLNGSDIVWVEAANQYVQLHTNDRVYTVSESLSRYAKRLADGRFFRIHRSALVNAYAVERVVRRRNGTHVLALKNGHELVVARSRAALIPDILRVARRAAGRT